MIGGTILRWQSEKVWLGAVKYLWGGPWIPSRTDRKVLLLIEVIIEWLARIEHL